MSQVLPDEDQSLVGLTPLTRDEAPELYAPPRVAEHPTSPVEQERRDAHGVVTKDDSERADRRSDQYETIITIVNNDPLVRIYSSTPKHLRRLRSNDRVTEVRTFLDDDLTENPGEFTVPQDDWSDNPLSSLKRTRTLTPEQREAAAQRMRDFQASKASAK